MRSRRKRPNWPHRFCWMAIVGSLLLYTVVHTWLAGLTFASRSYGIDWGLAVVAAGLNTTIAVWFVAVGASIGSFLNVVAYRLPLGRNIGGHSGCPYCKTPIDGTDNVPVLAWVRLRGRCRACRLPISAQYPLVELTVAIVFLLVFATEFATYGANLPGAPRFGGLAGLMRGTISPTLIVRTVAYLFALSGLIAAGLMATKRSAVPFKLYLWSLLPIFLSACFMPGTVVVRWRSAPPVGTVEAHLDGLVTVLCGCVAGVALARLLAPLLYRGFDRSLMLSDVSTRGARQFIGAMAVAGGILGWQSMVMFGWVLLVSAMVASILLRRFRQVACLSDLTVWVWLGLLIFRGGWTWWTQLQILPDTLPVVVRHIAGAIALAPMAIGYRLVSHVEETPQPQPETEEDIDPDHDDSIDEPTTDNSGVESRSYPSIQVFQTAEPSESPATVANNHEAASQPLPSEGLQTNSPPTSSTPEYEDTSVDRQDANNDPSRNEDSH